MDNNKIDTYLQQITDLNTDVKGYEVKSILEDVFNDGVKKSKSLNKTDQEYVQGIEALLEGGGVIDKETLLDDIKRLKKAYPKDYYFDINTLFKPNKIAKLTYILCQHQSSDVIKNLIKIIKK